MGEDKNKKETLPQNLKETQRELEQCKQISQEYLTGWKRERADFLNYKREESQRKEEMVRYATEKFLSGLLPVIDSMYLAKKNIPEEDKKNSSIQGLLQIISQLETFLSRQGVEEIPAEGTEFDPSLHEAVAEEEQKGVDSGQILEVLEKGYQYDGKVLRAAKVKVAK